MQAPILTSCILVLLALLPAAALDNGLGLRPQLAFNSWNIFACKVNETVLMRTMDLFVSTGLRDAGWGASALGNVIGVDDCWAHSRDPVTNEIQSDPVSFPSGMQALVDYAHARGLGFGLYSSNSPSTCAGRPGSFGYEAQDAATYARWGVDLLKYGEFLCWHLPPAALLCSSPSCKPATCSALLPSPHPALPSFPPSHPS